MKIFILLSMALLDNASAVIAVVNKIQMRKMLLFTWLKSILFVFFRVYYKALLLYCRNRWMWLSLFCLCVCLPNFNSNQHWSIDRSVHASGSHPESSSRSPSEILRHVWERYRYFELWLLLAGFGVLFDWCGWSMMYCACMYLLYQQKVWSVKLMADVVRESFC